MTKELKIEFAPGAFDEFEGTQEELDELINQIQEKFANMTVEELNKESRQLDEDDIDKLIENNPALAERLIALFSNDDEEVDNRKLQ